MNRLSRLRFDVLEHRAHWRSGVLPEVLSESFTQDIKESPGVARHPQPEERFRMRSKMRNIGFALLAACLLVPTAASALLVFEDSGLNAVAIQDTVDAYRVALGNPNNANSPGPLPTGRREINWDGGGPPVVNGTAPVTPFTVFQNTRGLPLQPQELA